MKILMFGRGVINTQYAYALEKAGHTVDFELQAYCQDVYSTAKEMNIPLPRYEAQRKIFQQK